MGVVHGLTNVGGSLLTAIIHSKHYDKDQTRATTAVSYGTFALFQLLTLALSFGHSALTIFYWSMPETRERDIQPTAQLSPAIYPTA